MYDVIINKLKNQKVFLIFIAILVLVEFFFVFLTFKSYYNKDIEQVKTNSVNKNNYNTYVQSELTGKYEKYNSADIVPTDTTLSFNVEKSYCEDINHNKIDGVLTLNADKTFTLSANITTSCYIYYSRISQILSTKLINTSLMWQSNLEGDGYRFTGSGNASAATTPKNFICFGTTSRDECKINEQKYLYRIIGVFDDASGNKHAKLIKYKQLGPYKWNANDTTDIPWEQSDLYKGINGSYFATNATYDYMQNNTWNNKIENWTWSAVNTKTDSDAGPNYYNNTSPSNMYLHEMNRTTKTSSIGSWTAPQSKIGLMYASDYTLSLGETAKSMTTDTYTNQATLKTGWMHKSNNDITKSSDEWTLSRRGIYYGIYYAWYVSSTGDVANLTVNSTNGFRPVFYLNQTVKTNYGDGSYSHPYMIEI